ncbi:MAG: methyltransferase domain-containing protein [Candidatus Methanomethylicaceae archaeon]
MKILITFISPSFNELVYNEVIDSIRKIESGGHELDFIWLTGVPFKGEGDKNLCYNLERARQVALTLNYDYMLNIESDIIVPKDCLLKLLEVNADVVIGLTPERYEKVKTFLPIQCMDWNNNPDSMNGLLNNKNFEIKGCGGMALTLISRKVFNEVPFPIKFPCDFCWYAEVLKKGFKIICNPSVRTYHIERCGRIAKGLESVLDFWKKYIVINQILKKPWYYGIPDKWWWGLTPEKFLEELPKHLNDKKLWSHEIIEFKHVELGGGSNPKYHPNLDIIQDKNVDYVIDFNKENLPFFDASVNHIYASHFIEHFTFKRAIELLYDCYRVLKVGGYIELVIPDMEKGIINNSELTPELSRIIFGTRENEYQYHYSWFSQDLAIFILKQIGFKEVKISDERTGKEPCFTIVGFKYI